MKKILILFAAIICLQTAKSQEWKISFGAESPSLKHAASNVVQSTGYIGCLDNTVYLMRYTDNRKSVPYLVSYDKNLVEQHQTMLPNGKNQKLYGGFANRESIDLLMTDKEENTYKAYRLSYDPSTLEAMGQPKELASFTSSGNVYTFVSSSQSGEWTATIFAEVADNSAEWRINMYDTQLEELWSMELNLGTTSDWLVTDSADVVIAGYYHYKGSNDGVLYFNVIDGERDHPFRLTDETFDDFQTMEVVRYDNGKIYCTGLIKGEEQDITGRWSSGFYSLVFDTRSGRITHYEKIDFSRENIADLCNVAHRIKMKVLSTDRMSFCNHRIDKDGVTVLYERSYNLYVNGAFTFTDYVGMLIYRIDNSGHIAWHNTVPREVKAQNGVEDGVRTRLSPAGDNYTVFYIDHPSNIEPQPGKPAKEGLLTIGKSGLMALTVGKDGTITRQMIELPGKPACVGAPHLLPSGELLLLLSERRKSTAATLRYQ